MTVETCWSRRERITTTRMTAMATKMTRMRSWEKTNWLNIHPLDLFLCKLNFGTKFWKWVDQGLLAIRAKNYRSASLSRKWQHVTNECLHDNNEVFMWGSHLLLGYGKLLSEIWNIFFLLESSFTYLWNSWRLAEQCWFLAYFLAAMARYSKLIFIISSRFRTSFKMI